MSISVQCDSCFQTYTVGDDKAGRTFKCKGCGGRIEVPANDDALVEDDAEDCDLQLPSKPARPSADRTKRNGASGSKRKLLIAGGAVGVVVLLVFVAMFFSSGGGGAAPAPVRTVSPDALSGWTVVPDPPQAAVNWPDHLLVSIPIPGRGDDIIYPTAPSPFVAIGFDGYDSAGAQVWDLLAGKQAGEIRGKPSNRTKIAVSPDGKYLAVHVLDTKAHCKVEFWSFETGQQVRVLECDNASYQLPIIDFAGPDQFVTFSFGQTFGGAFKHRIRLWNFLKGKVLRETEVTNPEFNQYVYAVSPGGRYLATLLLSEKIRVYDIQAGILAGSLDASQSSGKESPLHGNALGFSPDGEQLLVVLQGTDETRISAIDMATGKPMADRDVSLPGQLLLAIDGAPSYKGPKVECLPNKAGYLLAGDVWIDGRSKRVVWSIDRRGDPFNHARRRPLPDGAVLMQGSDQKKSLAALNVPWKDVQASLRAIESGQPARLRPGMPVSLDVQVGNLQFGDLDRTRAAIMGILSRRLACWGFDVKDGQKTVLQVRYDEAPGETLAESRRDPANPLNPAPTGRTVQMTKGLVNVAWLADGGKTTLWSQDLSSDPTFAMFSGDATPEKARDKMFLDVQHALAARPIPYFIPEAGSPLLPLPGTTELKKGN